MNSWQTKKLGELLIFKNGLNKGVEYFGHGTPIVNYTDVNKNSAITHESIKGLVDVTENEKINCSAQLGDVFFTRTSETLEEIGFSSVLLDEIDDCVFSGYVLRGRPIADEVLSKYYKYSLRVPSIRKEIKRKSSMTTRALTSGKFLSEVIFTYPEKPEQRRIVAVLEVWDEYLELLDRKIALKEQLKKGLMQQLLTGKKRLPGFTDEWHDVKLLDLSTINKGEQRNKSTLSKQKTDLKSYPVINGGIHPSGYTDEFNTESMTITISEGGNSCGFVNLIDEAFWCGGHCYKLTEKQDVDKNFLFSLLKLHETRIMAMRVGSGLPNIQKSTVERMKFHITTDCNEQVAVGKIISTLIEEVEQLKVMNGKIRLQKKYLLKNLISGTIRTPENLHIKGAN